MFKQIFSGLLLGLTLTLFVAQRSEWVHHEIEHAIQDVFLNSMDCHFTCKVARVNFFMPTLELVNVEVRPKEFQNSNKELPFDTISSQQVAQKSLRANGEGNFFNGEKKDNHNQIEICSTPFALSSERSPEYRRVADSWRWSCKKYITGFSWLHLLLHRSIGLWVEIHDLDAHSEVDGTSVAILPHLKTLLSEVAIDIPLSIDSLAVKNGHIHLADEQANRTLSLAYHADVQAVRGQQKAHLSFLSGTGKQNDIAYFSNLGGTVACTLRDDVLTGVTTNCHCILPQIDQQSPVFITGSWADNEGKWRINNAENSLMFDPLVITQRPEGLWAFLRAEIPLSYCMFLATPAHASIDPKSMQGTCIISAQGYIDKLQQLDGQIVLEGVKYAPYPHELSSTIAFSKRDAEWKGTLHAAVNAEAKFQSSWWYDQEQDKGELVCTNQTQFALPSMPYWRILPHGMKVDLVRDAQKVTVAYESVATHDLLNTAESVRGMVVLQNNKAQLQGTYNDESYSACAQFDQFPYLESATYVDAHAVSQLACAYAPASAVMQGSMQFSFIRNFVKRLFNYDVQGQGTLEWDVTRTRDGWAGKVHLADGAIRLPETYNFINGLDASFAFDEKKHQLQVHDVVCQLHAGRVQCKEGVVLFDEQFKPVFMQVPLLFEQCMLNFKRDLFAMVSGALSITKQKDLVPALTGHLFIERAQLKENLLSQEFQKQLFTYSGTMVASHSPDMACDVTIESMHPIRIDTNVLKTSAQVHLTIKNNFADPVVTGAIRLIGGTIEFPYKPLTITEGTMRLLPGQLYNPMIELRAKSTIKNHTVALQITGSLAKHHIMFDSTPPLNEEQIIAILLVGSHEQSLATMAPALLVQNLKHALFGINEPTVFEKYMNKIAKPLNIHLVPSFTDQTGRGGLRGALEIDVNDRWRALIQKNFSLTEDTRFELDYLLSDDMTIRAIRDERRDVGGEIEMRWKL